MSITNNKRIAKNTLFLYFRMLLIMGVNLFAVRIVLKILGAEDYGINNVVGGIVAMLSFFTSTMVSSSLRFFAFELGRNDYDRLNQYFNLTVLLYLGFGILVVIIAETVGLWFLKTQMVIPDNRMSAAIWVYQFSVLSFILHMIVVPYNSMIIAHEKMNIYAYVSIAEASLKLGVVYLLFIISADKLKTYAVLLAVVTLFTTSFYIFYCTYKFKECKLTMYWNKSMLKELLSYSGWSLFGALAGMIKNQGVNILLNIFFNPIVNAARAIAFQVSSAMNLFVTNFYQAVRPQITKTYASGNTQEMMTLVFRSTRFCYYLVLILAIPILFETPYILSLWLGEVPIHTVLFVRLMVVLTLIESISYPLMAAISATGNIKLFQTITGGLLIMNLPVSFFFLKYGYSPEVTLYVAIGISIVAQMSRIGFMKKMHDLIITTYLKEVLFVVLSITILSSIAPFLISICMSESFLRLLILSTATFAICFICIYSIGISKLERNFINSFIISKLTRNS